MIALALFAAVQILLALHGRWLAWWLAVDQLLNVMIGSGFADESLSAFAHRRGGWRREVINGLFFLQEDHCRDAYWSERERKQLPPEYRMP